MRIMVGRKVGNLPELGVLWYLSQEPMHPYELSRTLRDSDARSIKFNHGSLYMVVHQLTKAGSSKRWRATESGGIPNAPFTGSPILGGTSCGTGCAI